MRIEFVLATILFIYDINGVSQTQDALEQSESSSSLSEQTKYKNPLLVPTDPDSDVPIKSREEDQYGSYAPINNFELTNDGSVMSERYPYNTSLTKPLINNGYLELPSKVKRLKNNKIDVATFISEVKAGNHAELFGSNPHIKQSNKYWDLSRRFVPQYIYTEKTVEDPLIPKRAPPEVVIAAARESALLEASKPINPTDDLIRKDILRSGAYWNSFWREEIDPATMLRSEKIKKQMKLNSVQAKINPGSKLYELVSKLKAFSPQLLYVINNKDNTDNYFHCFLFH